MYAVPPYLARGNRDVRKQNANHLKKLNFFIIPMPIVKQKKQHLGCAGGRQLSVLNLFQHLGQIAMHVGVPVKTLLKPLIDERATLWS